MTVARPRTRWWPRSSSGCSASSSACARQPCRREQSDPQPRRRRGPHRGAPGSCSSPVSALGLVGWLVTGWVLALVIAPGRRHRAADPARRSRRPRRRSSGSKRWRNGPGRSPASSPSASASSRRWSRRCGRHPRRSPPRSHRLVARLRARWDTEEALRAFADELDDATGDLIAANLILGARRRGAGLASVLEGLAESVGGRRARSPPGRGRPGQAAGDRAVGHADQRQRARRPRAVRDVRRAVPQPRRPGDPRRAAVGVRRHADLDAAHGHGQAAPPVPGDPRSRGR